MTTHRPFPILFSVSVLTSFAVGHGDHDLDVYLVPDPSNGMTITLEFIGETDGETDLRALPNWGGTKTQSDWFSNIQAYGTHGELETKWDSARFEVTIEHQPNEPISLQYTVQGCSEYSDVDDYTPLMTGEGMAFFTANTLLLPERWFNDEEHRLHVSLHWQELDALKWTGYPTFGDQGGVFTSDRVREGMLIAGSFRSTTFNHENARFHVVELGKNASFTPATLAQLAKPMLSSVHEYVDDDAPSDYLITYAPAGEPVEDGFALGGTAVTNAFAFYFDPNVDLESNEGLADVVSYVLCHEYVHNWNGIAFWLKEPDFEYQSRWFIEGFTDFITRRAIYEAELRNADWYTDEMRRVHAEYDSNPHRDLTNRDAAPRWIQEPDVSDMLYKRGELIALLIDQRVRTMSNEKHSLRDLIREFVQESKDGSTKISPERVFNWIEQHTDQNFRQEVEHLINNGGAIPFPNTLDSE